MGLRSPHIRYILERKPKIPWFELLSDNWLDASGIDGVLLDTVVERYPVALHGVNMNLGGADALDTGYLDALKRLVQRCHTAFVSDHLCFSSASGRPLHDLAPLPFTEEVLHHVSNRILAVQDHLGLPLTVENISAYLDYPHDTLNEAEFMNALSHHTGCKVLLDVNNLYVNQVNLQRDATQIMNLLDPECVAEIHLGGYETYPDHLVDAHNNPVCPQVWELYEKALSRFDVPTLIEWDNELPEFETLHKEQKTAIACRNRLLTGHEEQPCKNSMKYRTHL